MSIKLKLKQKGSGYYAGHCLSETMYEYQQTNDKKGELL